MTKAEYKNRKYNIEPYNPEWKKRFEAEAEILRPIFSGKAISIEHIGSTAVPGLAGKPTIDILITVEKIEIAHELSEKIESIGYKSLGDYINKGSHLFVKEVDNERLVNLHIFEATHLHVKDMISLRNYFRSHSEIVKEYGDLKFDLVKKYPDDYGLYRKYKDEWMENLKKNIRKQNISEPTAQDKIKLKIQKLLDEEITQFVLKGKGFVNNAYYIETKDGKKYIVKQERHDKEFQPQNDLIVEAKVARQLHDLKLSVPIPNVVFVSENPKMYGYEYVEGDLMREIWKNLSKDEKIDICRKLGHFHAEIGKKFTKEIAEAIGIKIDMSADLHPEVSDDYDRLILDVDVPEDFKALAKEAKSIFDQTQDKLVFQFLHNDSHHENIIIKEKVISGIIDFGNAEYGETAKEFSRYIRDFPDYFQHIILSYEKESGHKLSYKRLISNALISGFIDIVEDYHKGSEDRLRAEKSIATYRTLMHAY